jgi:phosphatidylinositol alpha 1,6-mannosyltransferase
VKQATSRSEEDRPAGAGRIPRCYVAIGDSFTAGHDGEGDGGAPPVGSWSDELAEWLRRANPSLDYHNLGVVRARSDAVGREQLERALELKPDLVSVICGANDVLLSVRPDVEAFEACFAGLLRRLRGELPDATIITATYPDPGKFADLGPRTRKRVVEGIARVNDAIRAEADEHDVLCLALSEHPGVADPTNVGKDGFHPSPIGHRRAAAAVLEALSRLQRGDDAAPEKECA